MDEAPGQVLGWVANAIVNAFSEINQLRAFREAVIAVAKRPEFAGFEDGVVAILKVQAGEGEETLNRKDKQDG